MLQERHILLIDDEERMAASLKQLLEADGYVVDLAFNGQEGLEMLRRTPPDLVITDIKMGDINGYDILRYVRENLPQTYTIVITGHANLESAIEAIHQKAFDYITKPFDFDLLRMSIERAFNQLEMERFREETTSMLTHDIKIPLQSIIGYAQQIYNRESCEFHPRAPDFVRNVCIYSQKALALIDNFLTSCKIESGQLFLCESQFDLNHFIEDLANILDISASKRHIRFALTLYPGKVILLADENLFFRAISNIMNNAIKFTPEGGTIRVITKRLSPEDSPLNRDSAEIIVTNPGPGIPETDLPHIFGLYTRARNLRSIEGSGLGLFVVKSVIEAHEGTVEVESRLNEYTTFRIIIPIREPVDQPGIT